MIRNVLLAITAGWPLLGLAAEQERVDQPGRIIGVGSDLAVIKKDASTGFANAGWKYDRYSELPSLDAGRRMVVADLQGPGIIRHTRASGCGCLGFPRSPVSPRPGCESRRDSPTCPA